MDEPITIVDWHCASRQLCINLSDGSRIRAQIKKGYDASELVESFRGVIAQAQNLGLDLVQLVQALDGVLEKRQIDKARS